MGGEPLSHALTGSGLLSVVVEGSDAAEGGEDSEEASEVVAGGAGHGSCVECPLIIGMGVGLCGWVLCHFANWLLARGSSTCVPATRALCVYAHRVSAPALEGVLELSGGGDEIVAAEHLGHQAVPLLVRAVVGRVGLEEGFESIVGEGGELGHGSLSCVPLL
jgi:hypothetical protein